MDTGGNPDFQDVREGTATVDPYSGRIQWIAAPVPGAAPVRDDGLVPDTVIVSHAAPRDTSIWALLLLAAGAYLALE